MNRNPWHALHQLSDAHPIVARDRVILTAYDMRVESARLRARLAGSAAPVFLYCEDAGNFLAGLLGALSAGREVRLPGHAAPGFLREIGAIGPLLVTDVAGLDEASHIVSVEIAEQGGDADFEAPDPASRLSFFTSGSTGEPKLCAKSLAQLHAEVGVHLDLWGAPSGPVVGTVSHQHIYGLLFRVFWPLLGGGLIVGPRQETWEAVALRLKEGSALISSPAHLGRIPIGVDFSHCPSLVFSSGGPLSFDAARSANAALGSYPVEVLGSTETGGVAWRRQEMPGALWTPLPQVDIAPDSEGALTVRSPFTGGDGFLAMGDQMELEPDGRFTLKPRLDRIVKIEGKRVSLPRVEQALRDLEGIADASAVDLPERGGALGAVVVLRPEAEKQLAEMGRFRYSRRIRQALGERLEPMERPRYWRFTQRIPENAQGKRAVADLRRLFASAPPDIPTVVSRHIGETEVRLDLKLEPELLWFEGHFPGQPILPGVAQLHIAASMAEEVWGEFPTGQEMSRVKFRHVMQPGDEVTLVLERKGSGRIDFRYTKGDEVAASGALKGSAP
ncbi:MAG: AMP-binding protein [Parvibaculum sp.]|uniref:AMP-binding protein n=1 Tax=Parvibaculum sp. TaxID=2024848 RepID=UPI002851A937|nr:AMP-binding protein [Parvibaculum sp.]MDR3500933.1 AMP-binding protein [Parvibaculum sp.]